MGARDVMCGRNSVLANSGHVQRVGISTLHVALVHAMLLMALVGIPRLYACGTHPAHHTCHAKRLQSTAAPISKLQCYIVSEHLYAASIEQTHLCNTWGARHAGGAMVLH